MQSCLRGACAAFMLIAGGTAAFADDATTGRINQGGAQAAAPSASSGSMPNAIDDPARSGPKTTPGAAANSGAATAGPQNPAIGTVPPGAPPGSSQQTVPSTISAENAAEDRLSILAVRLPLDAQQTQALRAGIEQTEKPGSDPNAALSSDPRLAQAKVGSILPSSVVMQDLPAAASQSVPDVKDFKYVQACKRLLIVDPENWAVVGVLD